MATVSDIITEIRVDIDDIDSTRWTVDDTILSLIKKALRRAENICIRKGLEFVKSSSTLTLLEDATTMSLPSLFKQDIGLFYSNEEIQKVSIDKFERYSSGTMWRINGVNIEFKTAATADTEYTFWYYPYIDFTAYTSSTSMPWSDRLNDVIVEYVVMRLQNIDEYDVSLEKELLAEMQSNILEVYAPLTDVIQESNGYSEI